jgi:hypothetical protein
MEIKFDLEAIFSKEKMEDREEEIYTQIMKMLMDVDPDLEVSPRLQVVTGALTSLTLQQLNLVQYMDVVVGAMNQFWLKAGVPLQIADFATWYDMQGLTPEEVQEYMEKKHTEFMKEREAARKRIISLEH